MPLPRPDVPAGRKTASDFDLSTDHPLVRAVYTAALRVSLDFIAKEKFSKAELNENMKLNNKTSIKGATGYILLWLLGIPIPVLLIIFLLRGCT
jgi:hypothetical protein